MISSNSRFKPYGANVAGQWKGDAAGDGATFTLTDGSTSATFAFNGNYSFSESDDGNGGTLIAISTVTITGTVAGQTTIADEAVTNRALQPGITNGLFPTVGNDADALAYRSNADPD